MFPIISRNQTSNKIELLFRNVKFNMISIQRPRTLNLDIYILLPFSLLSSPILLSLYTFPFKHNTLVLHLHDIIVTYKIIFDIIKCPLLLNHSHHQPYPYYFNIIIYVLVKKNNFKIQKKEEILFKILYS